MGAEEKDISGNCMGAKLDAGTAGLYHIWKKSAMGAEENIISGNCPVLNLS